MTAQEPLREGEIVTVELRTSHFGIPCVERYEPAPLVAYDNWLVLGSPEGPALAREDGIPFENGWTIVSRRDPEPEWADADAILVEFDDGGTVLSYSRAEYEDFVGHWQRRAKDGDVKSIKGLYLRPTDD